MASFTEDNAQTRTYPGRPAPPCDDVLWRRREVVGGFLWLSVVQYFVMMVVVQAAWTTPYSIVRHAISDLGAVNCTVFEGRDVCSPWHVASNISWTLTGLSIFLGAVLLWRPLARDAVGRLGLVILMVAGVGEFLVGLNPQDTSALHIPAALVAILGGQAAIMFLGVSLARRSTWRGLGLLGVALSLTGLTSSTVLLIVGLNEFFGLLERIAAYPILIWIVLAGTSVLRRALSRKRYLPALRSV